jgi:valyl-tRNA synthetase
MSHENTPNSPAQSLPELPAQPATDASVSNLPKAYDPSIIEHRWAEYWVAEKLFEVPSSTTTGANHLAQSFTQLLPPPNVTGRLHMGHMLNQTEMDILTRWYRMRGQTSLWVPGTDHAGIATQMMVERQLASEGTNRKALGREAFTERVWAWKYQYGSAITDQMRRLGASVDWSREYFTMDERLSIAVKEAFVRLYQQGLIYRGSYIVNWDPLQQTAVSDLEVVHEDRLGKLYHIRYPFADGTGSIVVATTRPETMLGDTAVAVNPNDARYTALIGKVISLPLSAVNNGPNRTIPILADDWAQPEFGTGAVKVTPAHDPNDFAIGQRHALPSLTILDETAQVALSGSPSTASSLARRSSPTSPPPDCLSKSATTTSPSHSPSAPAQSSSHASPCSGFWPSTRRPRLAARASPPKPSQLYATATSNSLRRCMRRSTWSG